MLTVSPLALGGALALALLRLDATGPGSPPPGTEPLLAAIDPLHALSGSLLLTGALGLVATIDLGRASPRLRALYCLAGPRSLAVLVVGRAGVGLGLAWALAVPLSILASTWLTHALHVPTSDPWGPAPWLLWSLVMAALALLWPSTCSRAS